MGGKSSVPVGDRNHALTAEWAQAGVTAVPVGHSDWPSSSLVSSSGGCCWLPAHRYGQEQISARISTAGICYITL